MNDFADPYLPFCGDEEALRLKAAALRRLPSRTRAAALRKGAGGVLPN